MRGQVNGNVLNEVAVTAEVKLFNADPVHASVNGILEVYRRGHTHCPPTAQPGKKLHRAATTNTEIQHTTQKQRG